MGDGFDYTRKGVNVDIVRSNIPERVQFGMVFAVDKA